MFRWIIGSSLQYRFLVLGIAAALVVFGVAQLGKMPVDVFPEFSAPVVEVQTEAIGLSASEVESLVTLNLEELLSGLPWLKSIRSTSVTGLSSVLLTFERGTDIQRARQVVQERLTLVFLLPNVSQAPVIIQPLSATSRFMMVGISSKTVESTELSMLARWTIKPKLVGVPGVANVAIWGQKLRQLQVHIDPERLRGARVLQEEVIAAAGDALWVSPLTYLKGSIPGTGGWIDNQNQRLGVHHQMPIASPEDMAKIPVGAQHQLMTGRNMALGEVAEVTFSHPPLIGDAFVNGGKGLMLVIEKFPNADTLEVTRGVEQALAELSRGLPGVQIDADMFRLATYMEDSISNVTQAIIAGALLVLLLIGAVLLNWRATLVSAIAIPLALLTALVLLYFTGATLNVMIVAGLLVALAVIIDDAVIDVEKLATRLQRRSDDGASLPAIVRDTVLETRGVTLFATAILILAVTPIFFLGGVSGAFFQPLALSYVLAVLASLLVALTVTPALSALLFASAPRPAGGSPAAAGMHVGYAALLQRAVGRPGAMVTAAAALLVAGIAVWPLLGQSLLPNLMEGELVVSVSTPPGTSYDETYRITSRISREMQSLPGVRKVGAHVGRAITGDQIVGINSAQIWVSIDGQADYDKTVAAIRETVEGYPGIDRNVQTYLREKVSEVLTGAKEAIVVRIYGQKREVLLEKAEEVRQALAGIPGIVDLRAEGQVEEPQVHVKVNLDAAGRASVKPGDVRRTAAAVFSGLTVGYLFEEQRIYDVVVWGAPEARNSLSNIRDLWVEKADRNPVRLSSVADVSIEPTPTVIRHDKIAPYVDVVANVAGRDLGSVAREVDARLGKIKFPLEYHPELLGEYAERLNAQQRILGISIAALIGIFLLLQACFGSWRLALVAFLALPAAIAGGVLAVFVSGGSISLGSIVGILAVLGIAARQGLMLIDHFRKLESQEGMAFGLDLVLRGARERLSPILASSAAMVGAALPIVVLGQIPGLEILQPTAVVILGGLVASALVTLFVMPALYLLVGARATRQFNLGLGDA